MFLKQLNLPSDLQRRPIFRLALGIALASGATAAIGLQQALPLFPVHAVSVVAVEAALAVVAGVATWLAYRGRVAAAARLLLIGLLGLLPLPALWLQGLGPALALMIALIGPLVGTLGLQLPEFRRWMAVNAVVALAVTTSDWWLPLERFPPFNNNIIFVPTVLLAAGILISIARRYRWLPLRVQLVLAAVGASAVPVMLLAIVVGSAWQRSLINEVGRNLHNLAETRAAMLAHSVTQHIDLLTGLSSNLVLRTAVENPPGEADLALPNDNWPAGGLGQVMEAQVLGNIAADELRLYQARFPALAELFITDRHGAVVAASQPTSDFLQADEAWWQAAWAGGQGAVYVGVPQDDVSSHVFGLPLAVPIQDDSGAVVGVLRGTYNLAVLIDIVADTHLGRTGAAELWLPGGEVLTGSVPLALSAGQVAELRPQGGHAELTVDNWPYLVSAVPVLLPSRDGPDALASDLGWTVVVHQQRAESLIGVTSSLGWAILLITLLVGAAGLIGAGLARQFGDALSVIVTVVEQVRAGNLTARIGFKEQSGDLPRLASAVDHMAATLQQRADENRHSQAEIERQAARVEALLQAAGRLAAQLDEATLWSVIGDEVAQALAVPAVSLSLYDLATDSFRFVYARGLPPGLDTLPPSMPAELFQVRPDSRPTTTHLRPVRREVSPAGADQLAQVGLRTLATVELWHNHNLIGQLHLAAADNTRRLTDDDQLLLLGLGHQAALALANSRLYAQARRRAENLVALRNIDQAIIAGPDLARNMEVVLAQILGQLRVDAAAILLYQADERALHYLACQGLGEAPLQTITVGLGEGYPGEAAVERRMLEVADLRRRPSAVGLGPHLAQAGYVAYFAAPLLASNQLVGVLELFHRLPLEVDAEWRAMLETLAGQAAIAIDSAQLFVALQRSNDELTRAYEATLAGWSAALDLRDRETEGHTQRVTELAVRLAQRLGMAGDDLVHLRRGALLHDIGKMGVPDAILLKPGPLTAEEFAVMRQHPQQARELLTAIAYLAPSLDIPYSHHEKWDGSGYPQGLAGEAIPYTARLFALVDVWDALRSDRPYRRAWSPEATRDYIRAHAGTHFDPAMVEPFLAEVCSAPDPNPAV